MKASIPTTLLNLLRSRAITPSAVMLPRSSSGFSEMKILPSLLEVELGPPPGLPRDEPTFCTAGSFNAAAAKASCSGTIAS